MSDEYKQRVTAAIDTILDLGGFDGGHHKQYALDQALRVLTGCPIVTMQSEFKNSQGEYYEFEGLGESDEYTKIVTEYKDGEDGPETYEWDEGIAP